MIERFARWWIYFRRGHSLYLAFAMSFANFVVIQYRLLIEYVPFLKSVFGSLLFFATVFGICYAVLATLIGWLDYKKFSVKQEMALNAQASPYARDLAKAIVLLAQGRNQEAVEVLKRWVEDG